MSATATSFLLATALCLCTTFGFLATQEEAAPQEGIQTEDPQTKLVQSLTDEALFHGMNCMDVSPDGRFLYASAWRSNSVSVFDI